MHDSDVVAFEIRRPWPKRDKTHDAKPGKPRWKARYQWATWRKPWNGWMAFWTVAGRGLYWPPMIVVWHREPGGHDSGEICKHHTRAGWNETKGVWIVKVSNRWRWHMHHWRIQVPFLGNIRRFFFERCIECGRRYPWGYATFSHQWDEPRGKWFRITHRAYHYECSSLVHYRRENEYLTELVKYLAIEIAARSHEDELSLVDRLTGTTSSLEFYLSYRLQRILGFERDNDYNLIKKETGS